MTTRLASNSLYNVVYKLFNALFPLIFVSYASHIIEAEGIGKVSSAQNIAQYFVIIASLGIPNYGIREIARNKDNLEERSYVFSELFFINFISSILCTISYYFLISISSWFNKDLGLYYVMGLTIFLNIFNIEWAFQGLEEYRYIAIRSFVVKLICVPILFLFVKTKDDYIEYAIVNILATTGNYILNALALKKNGIKILIRDIQIRRHIKPVFVLLCTAISIELYTLLDTTMLTFLCTSKEVAYYTNSIKLVKVVIMIVTGISGVLLPRLSYYYSRNEILQCSVIVNRTLNILLFIFIPCGVGLFSVAEILVPVLFGLSFLPAIITLRVASILIFALGFSNLFGTQVLLTFNGENKLLVSTIIGAVTNILLNAFMIPIWKQNGATIASIISEAIVTIITFIFSKKFIHYCVKWKAIVLSILSSLLFIPIVKYICSLEIDSLVKLVLAVLICGVLYFVTAIIFKNQIFRDLIAIIIQKEKVDHNGD